MRQALLEQQGGGHLHGVSPIAISANLSGNAEVAQGKAATERSSLPETARCRSQTE
jgi:hypothetical protein